MTDVVRFTNGYLAMPDGTAKRADLYISPTTQKIISGQSHFYNSLSSPARTIDLGGCILSPGLIDVQINGAYGVDFSELDDSNGSDVGEERYVEGLEKVARRIVETGCTSFVGTVITQEEGLYKRLLRLLSPRSPPKSAHVLGFHAEGPFLHPLRKGAHAETLLLTAGTSNPIATLERLYSASALSQPGVKLITLAPDVEGVMECIPDLAQRGVTVSIGHSDATLEQAGEAVDKGARMITHLFNAMPPIHHRDPGVIGLLGDPTRKTYYGLIVDGLHSHPNTVRIAYGARRDGCVLVTDAQSIMDPNLPDGVHDWRPGVKFRKDGYRVVIDGTDTLAGSNSPLPTCLQNLSRFTQTPLPQVLLTATLNPAQLLNLNKGQLTEGFDADLCIMGWDGVVRSTWVDGEEVWRDIKYVGGDYLGDKVGEEGQGMNGDAHGDGVIR